VLKNKKDEGDYLLAQNRKLKGLWRNETGKWFNRENADRKEFIMQKWEYLTVQLANFGGGNFQVAPRLVNEQELKDWKKLSIGGLVNQLGNDGWEMTGTVSVGGTFEHYLFFKRPKS